MMTQLRRANAADLPAIIALLRDSSLPWEDLSIDRIESFLVAMQGETLQGVVGLEHYGDEVLLRSLAVQLDTRSTGLGHHLVAAAEKNASQVGAASIHLLTTTAKDFFVHLGYNEVPRAAAPAALQTSTEFASLCPTSAVCMTKTLPSIESEAS